MRAMVYQGPGRKAWEADVFAQAADTGALKVVLSR